MKKRELKDRIDCLLTWVSELEARIVKLEQKPEQKKNQDYVWEALRLDAMKQRRNDE